MTEGVAETYWLVESGGSSTEALVAAGHYGYAHSCVTSDNFPARPRLCGPRQIALLDFGREVTSPEAIAGAARVGLARPVFEDALRFGIEHPDVQREGPVVFLHDPWFGYFGRWDVICLWSNGGRRELGLEDYDGRWSAGHRFAFVRPGPVIPDRGRAARRS